MNMTELVSKVTADLGNKALPKDVLEKSKILIRKALQEGESIDFLGLVHLRLTAEGLSGKETGAAGIFCEPLPGLIPGSSVGEKEEVVVVIAAEKTDKFNEMLAKRLTKPGRAAYVAAGMTGVMDTVRKYGADVVIMDSDVEMSDELRQWLKTAPERSLISLIAVYKEGETVDALNRFRICEDEFIAEPYDLQELEQVIANEIRRINLERKYFRHEVTVQFPAKAVFQEQCGDLLEKLAAHSGLDEESQMGLVVACREAVDNACRHGSKAKKDALVTLAYVLDKEKATVSIEDEGAGFDTSLYLQNKVSGDAVGTARQRHKEGRQGGLGIMLMLKSVDRMEYNKEGNMVKLTRFLTSGKK